MKKKITSSLFVLTGVTAAAFALFNLQSAEASYAEASSHREAPMIANDPLTDNTDLYAFRSPDDTNFVTIIANYVPLQLPQGGPNYASFGENIRYEVHVENDGTTGDDITYRFTFSKVNQDPTTFFNIRLGQQNLKTTYLCEKSLNGGPFSTIVTNGTVPPPNIGPRSISDPTVGLGAANYDALMNAAIVNASGTGGEVIYCGPADDPFFVDLGGIFDVGQTRAGGTGVNAPEDGVACKNIHSIALKIPIATLQKNGQPVSAAVNILDSDYIIGVWASASRQQVRTLNANGTESYSGAWIQVSRIGMPLTNEAVIPIGDKDRWNSLTPYTEDPAMDEYFCNPELGLYMDNSLFGGAVPALSALRIQRNSLQSFDFGNTQDGLWPIRATNGGAGTALDTNLFGNYLLRQGKPRSVDLLPIFYTGVPNLAPYQLATGKNGNPLAVGKPFINNFLPTFGDMLRLNMAVPVTPRNHPQFSSLGIVQACVLGLTDPTYTASGTALVWIPNMDGFPNGRRLEDDVTRIELQAVSGVALAAIGLWYDDFTSGNPVTQDLVDVLSYTTGVEQNDTAYKAVFPYVQAPWEGFGKCGGPTAIITGTEGYGLNISAPTAMLMQNYPNPVIETTTIKYHLSQAGSVAITVFDITGKKVATLTEGTQQAGTYEVKWNTNGVASGTYIATLTSNSKVVQSIKMTVQK
jgi:Domain of unknown function (DUF4331)/Secretion system C-terminal sorting domain